MLYKMLLHPNKGLFTFITLMSFFPCMNSLMFNEKEKANGGLSKGLLTCPAQCSVFGGSPKCKERTLPSRSLQPG